MKNKKTVSKKVYGLLLEMQNTIFLSVQYAYSLEEATTRAKREYITQVKKGQQPPGSLYGARISLFVFKELEDLVFEEPEPIEVADTTSSFPLDEGINLTPSIPMPVIKAPEELKVLPTEDVDKNVLMTEIIKNKDVEKFEKNKKLFTTSERKYLREQLKR